MELLDQVCCMFHLQGRELRVFRTRVALPFDKVLYTFLIWGRA